ncbi:helix-turn-helix transcriptional regulator [Pseudomonas sp. MWU12-2323]|uniref:helix-turn-helix transcriptional regulator n=1 Tax=Pseudomonas sp. MWU12-2323 TaxID=2651296 RepID=UPI003557E870
MAVGGLRECRKYLGLTQQELGELLGVSRNTLRSWEIDREPGYLALLVRGLRAYKVLPQIGTVLSGPCLVEARGRLGMHQEHLAARLGVSRPTLSRWENDTPPRWVSFAISALAFTE